MKKTKIMWQGKSCEAIELDFETQKEQFNLYKLEDGNVMKVRTIITNIFKLNEVDPRGRNIYVVDSSMAVGVSFPEEIPAEEIH